MHPRQKAFPGIFVSLISLALSFFGATLSGGSAANAAGTSAGTISMSSATAGAVENLGVRTIGVLRTGGSLGAASVLCNTANGTAVAGKDYSAVSRVITWASGDATEKWCNVTISDATPFSGEKTFYVKLSGPTGAPLGTYATTKVTIYGNKGGGLVSLSAPTYTVAQNAGSVTIAVNRTKGGAVYGNQKVCDRDRTRGKRVFGYDHLGHRDDRRGCGDDIDDHRDSHALMDCPNALFKRHATDGPGRLQPLLRQDFDNDDQCHSSQRSRVHQLCHPQSCARYMVFRGCGLRHPSDRKHLLEPCFQDDLKTLLRPGDLGDGSLGRRRRNRRHDRRAPGRHQHRGHRDDQRGCGLAIRVCIEARGTRINCAIVQSSSN